MCLAAKQSDHNDSTFSRAGVGANPQIKHICKLSDQDSACCLIGQVTHRDRVDSCSTMPPWPSALVLWGVEINAKS